MADHDERDIFEVAGRPASPALSEFSELTVLSRSPSPVLDYHTWCARLNRGSVDTTYTGDKLRGEDGRYACRKTKRAHSPEQRLTRKVRSMNSPPDTPRTTRKRREALEPFYPIPEPGSPMFWIAGQGGFGTMNVLPKEIRQVIFARVLETDRAITVKRCCGPNKTTRERDACQKHGVGTQTVGGRFSILSTSRAVLHEASWVLYNQGSLRIDIWKALKPYLDTGRSRSLRHLGSAAQKNGRKTAIWDIAARFRFVQIRIPEHRLKVGDPEDFTSHVVEVACLIGKCWEDQHLLSGLTSTASHYIRIDLGSIFHQILPFNLESQAEGNYGVLLDWIYANHPTDEPDLDRITAVSKDNLRRLARAAGLYRSQAQWIVAAKTQVAESDEGGAKALLNLQTHCAMNGVVFEHLE